MSSRKPTPDNLGMEILKALADHQTHPTKLAEELETSYHFLAGYMEYLRENGFIEREKQGRKQIYSITGQGKKLLGIMKAEKENRRKRLDMLPEG